MFERCWRAGVELLAARLDELRLSKDYVIANCSADLSPTAIAAIWRANFVVIPILQTAISQERLQKTIRDINRVKRAAGATLPCHAWILPVVVRGQGASAVPIAEHFESSPASFEIADVAIAGHQEPFPFHAERAVRSLALRILKAAARPQLSDVSRAP